MSDLRASTVLDLTGLVAVVTGGGTGISLIIARGLAANGAKVYITGRRINVLQEAAKSDVLGSKHALIPLHMDVTDQESIENAVKIISDAEGKLDILVNNAGYLGYEGSLTGVVQSVGTPSASRDSFENWQNIFKTNVSGPFFVTTAFAPLLVKGAEKNETASVVNIGSSAGTTHVAFDIPAYVTSKGALEHLSRVLATDFALKGMPIHVNSIASGPFESEIGGDGGFLNNLTTRVPAGQIGAYTVRDLGGKKRWRQLSCILSLQQGNIQTAQPSASMVATVSSTLKRRPKSQS